MLPPVPLLPHHLGGSHIHCACMFLHVSYTMECQYRQQLCNQNAAFTVAGCQLPCQPMHSDDHKSSNQPCSLSSVQHQFLPCIFAMQQHT